MLLPLFRVISLVSVAVYQILLLDILNEIFHVNQSSTEMFALSVQNANMFISDLILTIVQLLKWKRIVKFQNDLINFIKKQSDSNKPANIRAAWVRELNDCHKFVNSARIIIGIFVVQAAGVVLLCGDLITGQHSFKLGFYSHYHLWGRCGWRKYLFRTLGNSGLLH